MSITKTTELKAGDAAYLSATLAEERIHLDFTGSIANATKYGDYIKFPCRVAVVEFNGKRDTAGNSSGSTTVALRRASDAGTISSVSFAQSGGDNLKAAGAIVTTSNVNIVEPNDYLYCVTTAEETTNGAGLHLNIVIRKILHY